MRHHLLIAVLLTSLSPLARADSGPAEDPASCSISQHAEHGSQNPETLAAADAPGASLATRIDSVLPTDDEDRFLSVPWRTNLEAARREAQAAGKPIYLWIMVGNPQGCT